MTQLKTLGEILKLSTHFLEKAGVSSSRREAELLMADAFSLSRIELYMSLDKPCLEAELASLREKVQRRSKREPLGYILGEQEFFGARLKVGPGVLIPRNETELLVDEIAKIIEKKGGKGVLFDVCTGSGCIAIALKKRFPDLEVYASDLSREALAIAQKNALRNEVSICFLEGDLLAPYEGIQADYIVSNPPYITEKEYGELEPEVGFYEPKEALVSGVSGVEYYERILQTVQPYLKANAQIFFEIGTGQGVQIEQMAAVKGYSSVAVREDLAGHDRFVFIETGK